MRRLIFTALFAVAAPSFAIADSAAAVTPIPFDKFSQLAEKRDVTIDEKTKASILALGGETASKEVAHVAKLLRDGAEAISLKELAPVLSGDGVQPIASTMRRHDDPIVRFYANLVLASSGDTESSNVIHGIIHDESLALTDMQMIRTWCDGVGIRAADDDAKKILEHLTAASRKEPKLKKGDIAPDFSVNTTDGITLSSAKLRGKVIVLHFWATSCGPCLGQMPSHIAALAKHDKKEVEIVFVSLDDDEKEFQSTVEKYKMPFNNVRDARGWGGDLTRAFGVNYMPFDVIIDGHGKIASNTIDDITELLSKLPAR